MVITQPKQFRIKPHGFKEIKRKYLLRLIPILTLGLTLGMMISYVNVGHEEGDDGAVLPIAIPVCVLVLGFSIYRSFNRGKALFESFTLTIEPNSIFRDQLNTPTIHIYHSEVTQISRLKNGGLLIKSADSANLIGIPAQVENKEELEALLNQIRPIDDTPGLTLVQKYPYVFTLLYFGLMGLVFISENRFIVTIGGAVLTAYMVWAFTKSRNNNNLDQRTKRGLWWLLVIFAALVLKAVFTFIGFQ